MKNNTKIIITSLILISVLISLFVYDKKYSLKNIKETNEMVEDNIYKNDSILEIFDNKMEQQKIERNKKTHDIDSLSQSLYDGRLVLKSKDITIEEQVIDLKKTLKELNDKSKLVEEQSKIAQEMKNVAELHREEALKSKEESIRIVQQLKKEKSTIQREVDKLKEECLRLNKLLGNDYNINKIDSIINLPDSIRVNLNSKKNKIKRRKQKK